MPRRVHSPGTAPVISASVALLLASSAHAQDAAACPEARLWSGVAASRTDPGMLLAWAGSILFAREPAATSADGAFRPLLTGDRAVVSATIDERRGLVHVIAADDDGPTELVTLDGARVVRRGTVPGPDGAWVTGVAAGGGVLALVTSPGGIAISRDAGQSFRVYPVDLGGTAEGTSGDTAVELDGTVRVLDVEVNTCSSYDLLEWVRFHVVTPDGRSERREWHPEPFGRAVSYGLAAHGAVYSWGAPDLFAVTPHRLTRVRGFVPEAVQDRCPMAPGSLGAYVGCPPPTPAEIEQRRRHLVLGDNGRITLGALGSVLLRLEESSARVLSRDVPASVSQLAVDARGRAVVVTDAGAIYRFSRRDGWTLLSACAP